MTRAVEVIRAMIRDVEEMGDMIRGVWRGSYEKSCRERRGGNDKSCRGRRL